MDALRIERFHSRYRLPAAWRDERRRLDRLFGDAVEPLLALTLEAALARQGLDVHEEICLRDVQVFARLRLSQPDTKVAMAWSETLAAAIGAAARAGRDLVRYGSRHHALIDVLVSVARGDLSRVWAWRQLGLWSAADLPGTTPAEEALQTLMREAAAAPAVLREAAARGALEPLLAAAPARAWSAVAQAALAAAGVATTVAPAAQAARDHAPGLARRQLEEPVERIARRSELLRVASARAGGLPLVMRRALAILAVLEVEPALLRDAARGRLVLDVLDDRLDAAGRAAAPTVADTCESATAGPTEIADAGNETEPVENGARSEPRSAPPDVRCRATTKTGGLLFLVHLVHTLELSDAIAGDPVLGARALRWVLHRLALRLAPLAANDPAALAFAGLRPTDEPPDDVAMPEDDVERVAIDGVRARLLTALRERLGRPDDSNARLLAFVCDRPAVVVADPGWIEVRYALDDVSTEIRRAGLDLDPGWLPWLGVVMRFVYV